MGHRWNRCFTYKTICNKRISLYRYKRIRFNKFLWRYYLPTAGIARYYKAAAGGLVTGICKLNEKFSFVVSGSGLFKQSSVFEAEGSLLLPAVDFFTAENKQFVGAEASTEF